MNFFKWLRWVFSKQLSVTIDSCVYDNVTEKSYYQRNGVFYEHNIRHEITNCIFNPYKEPKPNVVNLEIDMGIPTDSYMSYYTGLGILNDDENPENIIIPSDDLPFEITIAPYTPPLTEADRIDRFCDAITSWNKRMEHYDVKNMKAESELCQK